MSYRRKYRICRLYMMDMWGSLLRKARRSVIRGESESNEMVRLMRWSKQQFFIQAKIKEFYLRMKELRRKRRLQGGRLRVKYKIKRYYGGMNQAEYKRLLHKAMEVRRNRRKRLRLIDIFIGFFEKRVDVIVYRMHWALSIEEAQKLVREGYVTVNGKVVKNFKIMMKVGDVISLVRWSKDIFRRRIVGRFRAGDIVVSYPKYLEVNYRSMTGIIWKDPVVVEVPYIDRMEIEDVEGAIV